MTRAPRSRAWLALAVLLSAGFALLAHFAIIDELTPTVGALLSLFPVTALALWAARRTRHRAAAFVAILACGALLWMGWDTLQRHFPDLFFVEHAGANLALALLFGRTLFGGREALCTRFARLLHGTLPVEVERYSRRVTAAWTIFFATLFALSCTLYFGGFLAAWSVLANILSPILTVAMFMVEYAIRHRVLPQWERVGLLGGIRAFSRHFG
ncbi:MAG TPA: hypothetical protein VF348_08985 [Usitatibacter sp.]